MQKQKMPVKITKYMYLPGTHTHTPKKRKVVAKFRADVKVLPPLRNVRPFSARLEHNAYNEHRLDVH